VALFNKAGQCRLTDDDLKRKAFHRFYLSSQYLSQAYPNAGFEISPALNAQFDYLEEEPPLKPTSLRRRIVSEKIAPLFLNNGWEKDFHMPESDTWVDFHKDGKIFLLTPAGQFNRNLGKDDEMEQGSILRLMLYLSEKSGYQVHQLKFTEFGRIINDHSNATILKQIEDIARAETAVVAPVAEVQTDIQDLTSSGLGLTFESNSVTHSGSGRGSPGLTHSDSGLQSPSSSASNVSGSRLTESYRGTKTVLRTLRLTDSTASSESSLNSPTDLSLTQPRYYSDNAFPASSVILPPGNTMHQNEDERKSRDDWQKFEDALNAPIVHY